MRERALPEPDESAGAAPEAGAGFWTESLRVLLVEDNPGDADLLRLMLKGSEVEHHRVAELAEALEVLAREDFHAVLLDLDLPDACGVEALHELRRSAERIPIVVLTGQEDDTLAFEAIRAGAYAYLVKGEADRRLLVRTLRYAVERQRMSQELERMRRRERYLATHDGLTGLPNRGLYLDRLEQAVASAPRSGRFVGALFVDLDRFKNVNDTLGHASGDELLRLVAGRVSRTIRRSDTAARLGGDEFAVLVTNLDRESAAETVATKLLEAISEPAEIGGRRHIPAASIGVATYPGDGKDAESLLKAADLAMYQAKRGGRGGYVRYSRRMSAHTRERMEVEQELRAASATGELVLEYQPLVDPSGERTVGAEALVRWRNPRLGMLTPDRFIPVAEQIGLIGAIGRQVVESACRELRRWQRAGHPELRVAVNVSPRQLDEGSLVPAVRQSLESAGLAAESLTLELTESGFLQKGGAAVRRLFELRELGVRLAIDDFGTGYSSLGQLKGLPVHQLKIDRRFVAGLPEDPADVAVVSAILELARGLGLETVGEGVETEAQRRFLAERRCSLLQGFLFGRPRPPDVFARTLPTRPRTSSPASETTACKHRA